MDLSTLKSRKLINSLSLNKNNLPGFVNGTPLLPLSTDLSITENRINAVREVYGPPQDQYNDQQKLQFAESYTDTRNQIRGPYTKPSSSDSAYNYNGPAASSFDKYGQAGAMTADALRTTLLTANNYLRENEIIRSLNRSTQSVYGVPYNKIDDVNTNKIVGDTDKNWALDIFNQSDAGARIGGSVMPGWGHLIGGVVGGLIGGGSVIYRHNRAKEQAKKAAEIVNGINSFRYDVAGTQGLQQKIAAENEVKFNNQFPTYAKDGKLPKYANGTPIYTPWGPIYGIKPNAMVSSGEEIIVPGDPTSGYVAPGKPNNKDTKLAYLPDDAFVATNKKGISKYLQQSGDVEGAMRMTKLHLTGYKNGKLPRFNEGWIPNAAVSAAGLGASIAQYLDAAGQDIYIPNTYVDPVDQEALRNMAGARYNMFPIYGNVLDLLSHANRDADLSGGYSGGQRLIAKAINAHNAFKTLADTSQKFQQSNLGLFNAYNQARLNSAYQRAQLGQNANQYADTMFAKAHGAKQQGKQMGIYNALNQLLNFYANEFKRRLFNETMDLYRSENKINLQRLLAEIDNMNKNHSDVNRYAAVRSAAPTYFTTNSAPSMTQNSYLTNPNKFYGRSYGLSVPSVLTNKPWYLY